jgi:hypothetical protein
MALTKTEELRKKAQVLLAQAKKIEEEAVTKLGVHASKFVMGGMNLDELKSKAAELGFEIKPSQKDMDAGNNFYVGGVE